MGEKRRTDLEGKTARLEKEERVKEQVGQVRREADRQEEKLWGKVRQ